MTLKPYLQLVRLPNVFTAAADSLAGWLLVRGTLENPEQWFPLVGASAAIYAGGIALNDVFDYETDRIERPSRPLPSGQVSRRTAAWLSGGLLAAGLALAGVSSLPRALAVAAGLVACVLAYDGGLRVTRLGPQVMGACRGLNLGLGLAASAEFGGPWAWLYAAAYAAFVTGVTWFSRREVDAQGPMTLRVGLTLQALALVAVGLVAALHPGFGVARSAPQGGTIGAALLFSGVAFMVLQRGLAALRAPSAATIQRGVKASILSLIGLHVIVLLATYRPELALAVGILWFPAVYSGRWIYST